MAVPALHVLAGPTGAGKSTFYTRVLAPTTGLDFVNPDLIAAQLWPSATAAHAYEAAALATRRRDELIANRASFVTETVFSHPSKLELIADALAAGYNVVLHVMLVPEELSVARVGQRVLRGGHDVPEAKVRSRYIRLWGYVAQAITLVQDARVYDNSRAEAAFRLVAVFDHGRCVADGDWPTWTPAALRRLASPGR